LEKRKAQDSFGELVQELQEKREEWVKGDESEAVFTIMMMMQCMPVIAKYC